MPEKVSIELSVESAQAVRAWLANHQGIVQNEEALRSLEKASENATKKQKSGFEELGTLAMKTAAAYLSVRTALQLIGKEMDANERRRQKALEQQIDLGSVKRQAFESLHPGSDLTAEDLEKELETRSPIGQREMSETLIKALREGGLGGSDRRAKDTAFIAAEMYPHLAKTGELPELAAAAVDLQKQQPGLTERQSVARVGSLKRYSESSPGEIAKELIPAVARGRTLTGGKTDAGELEAFYLALQEKMDVGIGEAVSSGETFLGKISKAVGKPGLSLQELLKEGRGHKGKLVVKTLKDPKARAALLELLSGGELDQQFEALKTELGGSPEELAQSEMARSRKMGGLPSQIVAGLNRGLVTSQESLRSDPKRAMAAFRQQLAKDLTEFGGFASQDEAVALVDRVTPGLTMQGEFQEIERRVRARRDYLAGPKQRETGRVTKFDAPFKTETSPASPDELRSADALTQILAAIERQTAAMKDLERQPREVKLPANVQPQAAAAGSLSDR